MGEIAEMMIEGELCQVCGEYLGDGDGYPRLCVACARDHAPPPGKFPCPYCGRKVHEKGLVQHVAAKHPDML